MAMSSSLMKIVSPCWKPPQEHREDDVGFGRGGGRGGKAEGLLWYKDLGRHACGEFSMAMVQANNLLEDGSQIESGPLSLDEAAPPQGTFVGVYDGHSGPETSRYIVENLFCNLKNLHAWVSSSSTDKDSKDWRLVLVAVYRRVHMMPDMFCHGI